MKEATELLVGIDICEDFVQLAYYDSKLLSPESVNKEDGEEQYLIPARLAYRKRKKDWIIGDELEKEPSDEIIEVKNFVKLITQAGKFKILEGMYGADKLLQIFIQEMLKILKTYYPFKEIRYIGLTFPTVTKEISEVVSSAFNGLGFSREKYALLNHDEAFLYYTISQKPELWTNDTAVFELEEDGLHFRILSIDKDAEPMTARISRKEKTEKLTRQMIVNNKNECGNLFHTLSLMALEGSVVSTIYAVGRGFINSWADASLRKLSPGRRVFRGQNLYAKGACLAARKKTLTDETDIILLEEDRTTVSISIMAVKDGRNREVTLLKPAMKWYEAESEMDIIIKEEDELSIHIKDIITKKEEQRFISFAGINGAESGITRIRLSLKFKDRNTCIIKATDFGFGSFVPTTNRVWELIWEK